MDMPMDLEVELVGSEGTLRREGTLHREGTLRRALPKFIVVLR
jgi:hypothetical protein